MSGEVHALAGDQRTAVDPRDSVWLSASAGTGKTQVLSARVLRLLLEKGTEPSDILCLTFTKAGAAEMAVRVNEVLARWVRLKDEDLAIELAHIGASVTPETRARARSLFAEVLDCPGGGLRIDTIHAFAQWLLAAFPGEAGIVPGTGAMDDRERALLADEVLAELIAGADQATLAAIRDMSIRRGPEGVKRWLMRCAAALDLWTGPAGWQPPMEGRVRALLGLTDEDTAQGLAMRCGDARFARSALDIVLAANVSWGSKSGLATAGFLTEWLGADETDRLSGLDGCFGTLFTREGAPKYLANLLKIEPLYEDAAAEIAAAIAAIQERRLLIALAEFLAPQLAVGRRFALLWDDAKAREGLVDFDDLIRRAAALLSDQLMADWIRYKLDRRFDHILIDEAQDTNEAQWRIIDALTDDFFSGEGARGERVRTIFTVGDTKQAIFGFQGTSPKNFMAARDRVKVRMQGLVDAAQSLREDRTDRSLRELDLGQSFRTADVVLRFVDKAISAIGPEAFGLHRAPPPHVGAERPGLVAQWNLVVDGVGEGDEADEGASDWLARHDRMLADKIARQVREWMDAGEGGGFPLVKGGARRATPGDVMVLVRKRRELAALIVARLYAHGVPVAGVDRLRLGAPLAVQDLMAALRFAVQPLDDLNLASLLTSPIGGWTQDQLLEFGYREGRQRLWHHLRDHQADFVAATVETLREIMRRADFDSPQALLHWVLVGPIDGRRKLVARLGSEANDPIDELLNAANLYASAHTASLQGFIRWFDAGDGELKREAASAGNQVRVMTVHGSKGLQAPIVILADTAIGPDGPDELELVAVAGDGARSAKIPIPPIARDQRAGPLVAAHEAASAAMMEEHWRLLYVAMTRAEEALFIAGSLGPRDARRGAAHEDSWYARLLPLFGSEAVADPLWGARREWGALAPLPEPAAPADAVDPAVAPSWLERSAPEEPRPPRPLAPSGLGEVEGSDPPLPAAALAVAARRGVLIHALLERLPMLPAAERAVGAARWLERQASDLPDADRADIASQALTVMDHPDFAEIFGAEAMAEVPLAATVAGQVIAGTVDRLVVSEARVLVLDFKTARRPPEHLDEVPGTTLRQMAAYVAALEQIYPGRDVRAAVLYTQTPRLIALPPGLMAEYKSRFDDRQESFVLPPVD